MAEYLANAVQDVALNEPILMDASIPCNRGYVIHEDGTGVFILRGIVNNPTCRRARYKLEFNGNIAIPTGGTVGPIAVAITLNGETRPTSRAIFTPAAVDTYGNVTSVAHIDVPAVPTPSIQVINANLVIDRTA